MTDSNEQTPLTGDDVARLQAENERLRASLDNRRRWRGILTWILVVLTSLSVVASAVAVWAHQVVFDTDRFMRTVQPALDNPDFYVLVGDRASQATLEALDIDARLTASLEDLDIYLSDTLADALELGDRARDLLDRFDRPSLAELAPPIAASLETRIDNRIHQFFSSETFRSRFPDLVERVHRAAIALARNDIAEYPNVYVEDGKVRLNLVPFIGEALRQVGDEIRSVLPDFDLPDIVSDQVDQGRQQLAEALQAQLPEDFGQVTVMDEDSLDEIQTTAVQIDRYVWLLVIVTLVLVAVTLAVSPYRRRTLVHLGIGVFVAVVIVALVLRRLRSQIVESILDPTGAALADRVVYDFLSGLRNLELLLAVAAVVVAIVGYLAGRPAWYTRLTDSVGDATQPQQGGSQLDRWVAGHAGVLQIAGVVVAAILLFFAGLDLVSLVIIGLVLGGYMWFVSAASRRVSSHSEDEEAVSAL
ncbi:MAG TPA: hypothetical protein VFP42_02980 [Acidimicrobiia bacterium]|nr:hypothetical protein [Acidimicrobiia bacterium]